jgi:YVTN family beta-propeller protein
MKSKDGRRTCLTANFGHEKLRETPAHPLYFVFVFLLVVGYAGAHDFQLQPGLPNGLSLDPAGPTYDVGNMPLSAVAAPDGKFVMLLSGFRQQGVQLFDPETGTVTQTLLQPSAFYGLAFSSDGHTLYASGGEQDLIHIYRWHDGQAEDGGKLVVEKKKDPAKHGLRYPAGIALSRNNRYLYVAENMSDTIAVVDVKTGNVVDRKPTGHYPYAVVVARDGAVYVSNWGAHTITRFRPDVSGKTLRYARAILVNRHPSAMLLSPSGSRLFVASGSTDSIAILSTRSLRVIATLRDSVSGVQEGSTPNALAISKDGNRLFVAEADNNAVAVFDLKSNRLLGRIPTGWYPTALLQKDNNLYVINGKGRGTRANPKATQGYAYVRTPNDYALGQLNGTITQLPLIMTDRELAARSQHVAELNNWNEAPQKQASYPPFKHVLYIIKENRTYDQVFGDFKEGDGDPSLVFFPQTQSPNHRALAERFGLFDRFFVNAEVSSQGHPWSTSAYVTDYTEKTVHSLYADKRDGEAPDDEVSDPATGFLWDLAIRAKNSLRIYGEYAELAPDQKTYRSQKKAAAKYTSPTYPSFNMEITDQARTDAWLSEFREFVKEDEMPALQIFHLPNDHTAGAKAGMRTPGACFADNDLAVGRIVEAISNSPFWKDTVLFILEDDAQSGPDHVDSHRSVLLVISAYNKSGVWDRFVNTTDVLATVEKILGLGSLSQFDYYGRSLAGIFNREADLTPYKAIIPGQSLDERNPEGKNSTNSLRLKLDKEDESDDETFNEILWAAIKGDSIPYPGSQHMSLLRMQQEE